MESAQIPLLWHPMPTTQKQPNKSPPCVTAWIERGTYLLTESFVQPKWMWKPTQEMNLDTRRLNIAHKPPEREDLLEISRVQDSLEIDRQRYPFVHKRRSFTIVTRSEVHVFEAQSVRDKKRIVFGLKLTISRLASLIMTRDSRAVEEFFEPVHSHVPGKEPEWEWAKKN
jgi:hypothetical protein